MPVLVDLLEISKSEKNAIDELYEEFTEQKLNPDPDPVMIERSFFGRVKKAVKTVTIRFVKSITSFNINVMVSEDPELNSLVYNSFVAACLIIDEDRDENNQYKLWINERAVFAYIVNPSFEIEKIFYIARDIEQQARLIVSNLNFLFPIAIAGLVLHEVAHFIDYRTRDVLETGEFLPHDDIFCNTLRALYGEDLQRIKNFSDNLTSLLSKRDVSTIKEYEDLDLDYEMAKHPVAISLYYKRRKRK